MEYSPSCFSDLEPAVVTEVNDQSISVISKSGGADVQQIDWDGLKWARPFISDTKQGRAPKIASDIVAVGELIWVRQQTGQALQLSQYPDASAAFVSLNPYKIRVIVE